MKKPTYTILASLLDQYNNEAENGKDSVSESSVHRLLIISDQVHELSKQLPGDLVMSMWRSKPNMLVFMSRHGGDYFAVTPTFKGVDCTWVGDLSTAVVSPDEFAAALCEERTC